MRGRVIMPERVGPPPAPPVGMDGSTYVYDEGHGRMVAQSQMFPLTRDVWCVRATPPTLSLSHSPTLSRTHCLTLSRRGARSGSPSTTRSGGWWSVKWPCGSRRCVVVRCVLQSSSTMAYDTSMHQACVRHIDAILASKGPRSQHLTREGRQQAHPPALPGYPPLLRNYEHFMRPLNGQHMEQFLHHMGSDNICFHSAGSSIPDAKMQVGTPSLP
jgi:hypothetical protein